MSTAPKWHQAHMIGLDTETTGVDPNHARIVTAAIVHTSPDARPSSMQWLIHPETDIPAEAAEVHGWPLERLEARLQGHGALRIYNGQEKFLTRDAALFEIAGQAASAMGRETPLVVHNAAYDLTLLEAELERNGIDTLSSRPAGIRGVIDPMVIEKQWDPFRKVKTGCRGGKHKCGGCGTEDKKLGSLCRHYGIFHGGEHDAAADTLAAMRLAVRLAGLWPELARWRLSTLHTKQIEWRRDQSISLRDFWKKAGDERWSEVDLGWPLHSSHTDAQRVLA